MSVRDVIHPGGSAIGLWCTIPSPAAAELVARSGPDYVVVDQQHGAVSPGELLAMTQAIHGAGRPALVRVGSHDPWVIGHALDLGADGVIVPLVDSAAEAAAIVSACRYQPAGRRSWGRVRGTSEEEPLVLAMIETRAGLEAVGEIVAIEGLDGVYIGPSDLSLGLGAHPTPRIEHAVVLDAIATIRAAAEGAGVVCGLHCLSGEDAARFAPEGFSDGHGGRRRRAPARGAGGGAGDRARRRVSGRAGGGHGRGRGRRVGHPPYPAGVDLRPATPDQAGWTRAPQRRRSAPAGPAVDAAASLEHERRPRRGGTPVVDVDRGRPGGRRSTAAG